jgi:hypothetical protein
MCCMVVVVRALKCRVYSNKRAKLLGTLINIHC